MAALVSRSPHWRVPTTITAAFIAGFTFAIGHHILNSNLDGRPLDSAQHDQRSYSAFGTALAFLVRAALSIAIGGSYWQLFWDKLHQRSFSLSTVDVLAGLPSSLLEFVHVNALAAYPMLAVLALLGWLAPLAAVVPPATLSVEVFNTTQQVNMSLAVPDFRNGSTLTTINTTAVATFGVDARRALEVGSPAPGFLRTALGTAFNGALPKLTEPVANCSYSQVCNGPVVQCSSIDQTYMLDLLHNNTARRMNFTSGADFYFAWVPQYKVTSSDQYTFDDEPLAFWDQAKPSNGFDGSPMAIFIGSLGTALNCSLYNATYQTSFVFEGQHQTVSSQPKILRPVQLLDAPKFTVTEDTVAYLAAMDILKRILVGSIDKESSSAQGYLNSVCVEHSLITETQLAQTRELAHVYDALSASDSAGSREQNLPTLASAIEELFRNITLSVYARPDLLAPALNATLVTRRITFLGYSYMARWLLLSYGLALVLTLATIVAAFASMARTGATYSNRFSTVVRTTQSEELNVLLQKTHRRGEDPLPKAVGEIQVCIGSPLGDAFAKRSVSKGSNALEDGASSAE